MEKTIIKGPEGEDIYREDYTDEWGNVTKDGKVLASCGEWFNINPWKNEEIANAPMDQWFSLDEVWEIKGKSENIGKYWMNKRGEIKSISVRNKINSKGDEELIWKNTDFYISGSQKKKYYWFSGILVSIIYATVFLENNDPDRKTVVDHINGNSLNNHHINLRWSTRSENIKNIAKKDPGSKKKVEYFYAKFNKEREFIEWISAKDLKRQYKKDIIESIKNAQFGLGEYDGYLWSRYSNVSREYVERYGFPDDNLWVESVDCPNLFANPVGCLLVRYGEYVGLITVGGEQGNYYTFRFKKENGQTVGSKTSRLIYCILNNISVNSIEGLEIDHFEGFSNNINNLSLVTHKENMNNPNTRMKLSKPLSLLRVEDGSIYREYSNQKSLMEEFNIKNICSITTSLSNPAAVLLDKYLVAYKGQEGERYSSFLNSLFVSRRRIPNQFLILKENRAMLASMCRRPSDYFYKFRKSYFISKTIPGELDEFFPKTDKKKDNK